MAGVLGRQEANSGAQWGDRIKLGAWFLGVAGIALVFGMFVFGPMRSRAQDHYLPPSLVAMPTGIVELQSVEGVGALLPIRIADTSQTRLTGFRGAGAEAIENSFLLYGLTRQTTVRTSYSLEGVRAPLEFAVIDGEGRVVAITQAPLGTERLSVAEPHRWLLAAKAGTFSHYGITEGALINPESIRKINL